MSKLISNFQGRENALVFKAASGGINSSSIDNATYAKYIQNLVLNEDNNLSVRNGTKLVAEQEINENVIFGEQLKLMNYVNVDGKSEILIYQTYFIKIPFYNEITIDIPRREVDNISDIAIRITNLTQEKKDLLYK